MHGVTSRRRANRDHLVLLYVNSSCWTENWKPKCLDVSRSRVVSELVDHRVGPGLDADADPFFFARTPRPIGAWHGGCVELHEHL